MAAYMLCPKKVDNFNFCNALVSIDYFNNFLTVTNRKMIYQYQMINISKYTSHGSKNNLPFQRFIDDAPG